MKVRRTDPTARKKKVDPEVGPRIRVARELVGLNQQQLAEMVDGKLRGIQNNERGKTMPNARVIAALVAAGVNANWILSGRGPKLLAEAEAKEEGNRPIDPADAPAAVMGLQGDLGYDPGSAWTALLIAMLIERSITLHGARKVLEQLSAFRPAAAVTDAARDEAA
ncbi:MAG: helix-turn-helix transcriptional regulator [Burkholderiales bacterium]|nr:helix-turn-helix transcriptional regulator [Burkholderiales bacterium]